LKTDESGNNFVAMIYKIRHQSNILTLIAVVFFVIPRLAGQALSISKYGVTVVSDKQFYLSSVKKDSLKNMIELKKLIPHIVYDLRYATLNNFTRQRLYPKKTRTTFMRLPAARALNMVQSDLNAMGYGLKIYDAYRPYSVTVKFWELIKDERYVADPSKGSGHNRGLAIDLTIIDMESGKELDMGTGFDNFTDSAHHSFTNLSPEALNNRKLLKETMMKYGFQLIETEWWHYSWPNDREYEVLDLSFRKLNY
jgi:D-alanyl-D-alanine dipeptidase